MSSEVVVCSKRWKEDWSNLPYDLMSRIADGLGLEELHSLRRVSKDWRHVSSKAFLQKIESFGCLNWFLVYDDQGESSLIRDKYKISITIPELDGATCLASHLGWLLLFRHRDASLFFLCPFSGVKIDLPSCPFTQLSGHVAAFSAPPTCQDCIVAVIRRCTDVELELHLLSRGHNTWVKHNSVGLQPLGETITTGVFRDRMFCFYDSLQRFITFHADTKQWYRHGPRSAPSYESNFLDKLRLHENADSISILGNLHNPPHCGFDAATIRHTPRNGGIVMGKSVEAATTRSENPRHLKGLGIMPKYHTPIMDQKW